MSVEKLKENKYKIVTTIGRKEGKNFAIVNDLKVD